MKRPMDLPLFEESLPIQKAPRGLVSPAKAWMGPSVPFSTRSKSELVADYVRRFQLITRGGLYVDGFAAPQRRHAEDAWTAKRVLEVEPKRIRGFWLFDIDPKGVRQLQSLKQEHHLNPSWRRVNVIQGDFNAELHRFLYAKALHRDTAVFALLDQRSTECHWSTVQRLASRRGRRAKIELMYFCPTAWIHRSLKTRRLANSVENLDLWWGDNSWRHLPGNQTELVEVVRRRFEAELGYEFVVAYPIPLQAHLKRTSYHLIHASDHPEAPNLMAQAYRQKIMLQRSPEQQDFGWGPEARKLAQPTELY